MITEALYAHLSGDTDLVEKLGGNIFPENAGDSVKGDYLLHRQITAGAQNVLGRSVAHFRTLQQIEIFSATRIEAEAIAKLVRLSLDHILNANWGGTEILASSFQDQLSGGFDSERNRHRVIQQYRISWKEN